MPYTIHAPDAAQKLDAEGNVLATTDVLTLYDQNRNDKAAILAALEAMVQTANQLRDAQKAEGVAAVQTALTAQLEAAQARIVELEAGGDPGPMLDADGVPSFVYPRQIRLALLSLGITTDMITQMLDTIEDEFQRAAALIDWEYALTIRRDNPLVASLANQLSKTDEEVDQLFIAAHAIN